MEFIKYYTSPMFEKEAFVEMLWLQMNVRAKAVDDGVILDRQAFNAMRLSHMPHWAYINRESINSKLHTRPATPDEWPDLIPKARYTMALVYDDSDAYSIEKADGIDYLKQEAESMHQYWKNEAGYIATVVIDNATGKVIHMVEG